MAVFFFSWSRFFKEAQQRFNRSSFSEKTVARLAEIKFINLSVVLSVKFPIFRETGSW